MKRILGSILAVLLFLSSCAKAPPDRVTVDVLSIGKADCIVIRIQDEVVMIDTGEEENVGRITSFLQSRGIRSIQTMILSHFDKDHIGGAAYLIDHCSVENVIQSAFSSDRKEFSDYHKALLRQGKSPQILNADLSFSVGECHFRIQIPRKKQYSRKEDNNASLIVSMTYGNGNYLFCGDAMEERLDEFIAENETSYSFVKLPYHGRYLENLPSFLSSVTPKDAAVTCSRKNPSDERTLSLLAEKKIRVFETKNGTVHLDLTKDGYEILQTKK